MITLTDGQLFDCDSLHWFAASLCPIHSPIANWRQPLWSESRSALNKLFNLDRDGHFFGHHRGMIPSLKEPQITRAIGRMLNARLDRRLDRCNALLRALLGRRVPEFESIDKVTADDPSDRIDLAIYGRSANSKLYCIIIEAKLGSELSRSQLRKYQKVILRRGFTEEDRTLWVIGQSRSIITRRQLADPKNREWKFLKWRDFLLKWQAEIDGETGSDMLALLAELWERIEKE